MDFSTSEKDEIIEAEEQFAVNERNRLEKLKEEFTEERNPNQSEKDVSENGKEERQIEEKDPKPFHRSTSIDSVNAPNMIL